VKNEALVKVAGGNGMFWLVGGLLTHNSQNGGKIICSKSVIAETAYHGESYWQFYNKNRIKFHVTGRGGWGTAVFCKDCRLVYL
jgi:hypothetical protein